MTVPTSSDGPEAMRETAEITSCGDGGSSAPSIQSFTVSQLPPTGQTHAEAAQPIREHCGPCTRPSVYPVYKSFGTESILLSLSCPQWK